ncbi:tripartite tricarboxylate transporter substrate binding protein [Halomonas dongshanensis]|uniref:Tripartite tricarboxylate transporter substrate binding protein n=1 Tax=Halomonas dongshanensis TaxID=2890835 RepID=A0ABT2EIG8_9GAMM|nr:tripartite tricarboxylate transporter substrate binding protein [Halomonas dongshanensis]
MPHLWALLLWLLALPALANFPDEEVTLVIPFGPGGASDVLLREIAQAVEAHLGQPLLPLNLAGGSGTRGSQYVKDAAPDGYTLLGSHQTLDLAYLTGASAYSHADFEPVALLAHTINVPATYRRQNAHDASEIAALVAESPEPLAFGIIARSTDHLFWSAFFDRTGIDPEAVRWVHFPDTSAQVEALVGEEIDFAMLNLPSAHALFERGVLRPLGVAAEQRLSALPRVATLREQGIDLVHTSDRGIFAPLGTPAEHIAVLADAFRQALEDPELRFRLLYAYGSVVDYRADDAFRDYLDDQLQRLAPEAERIRLGR